MRSRPLLAALLCLVPSAVLGGWVDPVTPAEYRTTQSFVSGRTLNLVMSDEFETPKRSFKDGSDPIWTALDHSDDDMSSSGGGSLQYYNSSHVTTTDDGMLEILTTTDSTSWRGFNPYKQRHEVLEKSFRSGMVQTWNKFCFTGGAVEVSARLPGKPHVQGLWPAFWLLGNLGRATFEVSTNLLWPWSYDTCDRKLQNAQEISACDSTAHFGLNKHQGRGATEIDIIEAMPGYDGTPLPNTNTTRPYVSTSLQIAPGVADHRPFNGAKPFGKQKWYKGLEYGRNSSLNVYFYGTLMEETSKFEVASRVKSQAFQADAISAISGVQPTHFEEPHKYRVEWMPGKGGYLRWFIDDEMIHAINGSSLELMGSKIPEEPSYLIFNTAVSTTWGFPMPCPKGCDCSCYDCKKPECLCGMPSDFCSAMKEDDGARFLVDYVRIYQDAEEPRQTVGCDPPGFPTRRYIQAHATRYIGPRDTLWHGKPLKDVNNGGGSCSSDEHCGAPGRGSCASPSLLEIFQSLSVSKRCSCKEGYTGPTCAVFDAHDDEQTVMTDEPAVRPTAPLVPGFLCFMAVFAVAVTVLFVVRLGKDEVRRRKEGREGLYDPLR